MRTKADRYRLSLKLFELAHMHPPVNRLVESALPVMRELAADTDQSCHLVVLNGLQVLVVLQIDSPLPMRYSVALGSQFPILETSSGAVLLAAAEPADRERIVDQILAAGEADDTRDGDRGAARRGAVARLRDAAVAGRRRLHQPVAAGVRPHGRAIAALTVPFLPQKAARFDQETVFSRAQRAAEQDFRRARRRRARHVRLIVTTRDGGTNRPELNPTVIGRKA